MGGVTFAFPWLVSACIPAAFLLVYAYRRKRFGSELQVASLFILNQMEIRRKSTRFKPPLRFFFELFLLLLLALGASQIAFPRGGTKPIVVIDNSLSLAAPQDAADSNQFSALSDVEERVSEFVLSKQLSSPKLFYTSPQLTEIQGGLRGDALKQVQPVHAEDGLRQVVASLRAKFGQGEVYILTDYLASEDLDPLVTVSGQRNWAGSQFGNLAISKARWADAKETGGARRVEVTVANFNSGATSFSLELHQLIRGSESSRFSKVESRPFDLSKPGESVFTLEADSSASYALRLIAPPSNGKNTIALDDVFYLGPARDSQGLVIVSPLDAQALGVARLKEFDLNRQSPTEYERGTKSASAYVFHRYVPRAPVDGSVIFVAPSRASFPGVLETNEQSVEITSWNESSALLTYLDLAGVSLGRASVFRVAPSVNTLIQSDAGALAFQTIADGAPKVVFGIELFPFRGSQEPVASVLLLNALKWLERQAALRKSDLFEDGEAIFQLRQNGETAVLSSDALVGVQVLPSGKSIARNFYSQRESDLRIPPKLSLSSNDLPTVTEQTQERKLQDDTLLTRLAWLVLLLFAIEAVVLVFSRRRAAA